MSNQFLVEIHDYISHQIEIATKDYTEASTRGDEDRAVFLNGKIKEFRQIREFLSDQFDLITQKYY